MPAAAPPPPTRYSLDSSGLLAQTGLCGRPIQKRICRGLEPHMIQEPSDVTGTQLFSLDFVFSLLAWK